MVRVKDLRALLSGLNGELEVGIRRYNLAQVTVDYDRRRVILSYDEDDELPTPTDKSVGKLEVDIVGPINDTHAS